MPAPEQELPDDDSSPSTHPLRPRAGSPASAKPRSRRRGRKPVVRENDAWAQPSDLRHANNDLENDSEMDRLRDASRGRRQYDNTDTQVTGPGFLDSQVMDRQTWERLVELGLDGISEAEKSAILRSFIMNSKSKSSRNEADDFDLHEKKTMLSVKVVLIVLAIAAVVTLLGLFVYFTLKNGLLGEGDIIGGIFNTISEIIRVVN